MISTPKENELELVTMQFADPQQIDELINFIHDEHFDVDKIQYRHEEKVVEIPFQRMFHNGPAKRIRDWFFFKVNEVDVIRSRLLVNEVEEYKVDDPEQIGIYSFNIVKYDQENHLLLFQCEPDLVLKLKIAKFQIDVQDIEVRGKARISYTFGLIEGYSGKVYD